MNITYFLPKILPIKGAASLLMLSGLWLAEWRWPLRPYQMGQKLNRLWINARMALIASLIIDLLVLPVALVTALWAEAAGVGLLNLMALPVGLEWFLGLVLFDWTFYWWHRANHQIPLLWRFHNVHHTDPELDVTTALRFHFGELLLSIIFRVLQTALLGLSVWMVLIFETLLLLETLFHHSNLRLPLKLERWLNRLIVTPRMHGIHHSAVKTEMNGNYGTLFPLWDYLHKSLNLNIPQDEIRIGVAGYDHPRELVLLNLLKMPFQKQRAYWRFSDGSVPQRGVQKEPLTYMAP